MGGSTLYIETLGQVQNREADRCIVNKYSYHQKAKEAGTGGGVELTGNLGDVMKESIKIGGTFARFAGFVFFSPDLSCAEHSWKRGSQRTSSLPTHVCTCTCLRVPRLK